MRNQAHAHPHPCIQCRFFPWPEVALDFGHPFSIRFTVAGQWAILFVLEVVLCKYKISGIIRPPREISTKSFLLFGINILNSTALLFTANMLGIGNLGKGNGESVPFNGILIRRNRQVTWCLIAPAHSVCRQSWNSGCVFFKRQRLNLCCQFLVRGMWAWQSVEYPLPPPFPDGTSD